jgi:WD40 repeat protein
VVRVLAAGGGTAGTGFLVADRLIVTCAHVVGGASARPDVEFWLGDRTEVRRARVLSEYWTGETAQDVAVLELGETAPAGAASVVLGVSAQATGRDYATYGFPKAKLVEGMPGVVRVTGRTTERGYPVLAIRSNEVSLGFSGAPVWDPGSGIVIGMVISTIRAGADPAGKQSEVSFIRPAEVLEAVCELLRKPVRCPFRGLEAFGEDDAGFYFGRDPAIAALIELIGAEDVVSVVGVSGSGKSSLVRAGLARGFAGRVIPGLSDLTRYAFRPGTDPLNSLRLALGLTRPGAALAGDIRDLARGRGIMLIVDQFEQVFTDCREPAMREFIDLLLEVADSAVKVVLTLRADFYGAALSQARLGQALTRGQYTLLQPSDRELMDAVVEPARLQGRIFESGLAEQIVLDVIGRPGDLPLLEFALTELWHRDAAGGVLTRASYDGLGCVLPDGAALPGAQGAVVVRAEQMWSALSGDERRAARRVFLSLIAPGTTAAESVSRRAWRSEWSEDALRVAERLAAPDIRLLVAGSDGAGAQQGSFEIAHEALITAWPRLRRWADESASFVAWYSKDLSPLLQRWLQSGRIDDFLLPSVMLGEARRWLMSDAEELSGAPKAYIEASIAAFQARQAREADERARLAEALRNSERLRAEAVSQQTIAFARQLAAEAEAMYAHPTERDTGILLAIESLRRSATVEGDRALRHGLDLLPSFTDVSLPGWKRRRYTAKGTTRQDETTDVAVSADGSLIATADASRVRVLAAPEWRPLLTLRHGGWVTRLAFSQDGSKLAAVGADLRVWSIPDGRQILGRRQVGVWVGLDDDDRVATVSLPKFKGWSGLGGSMSEWDIPGGAQGDRGHLDIWDLRSGQQVATRPFPVSQTGYTGAADCVAVSRDWTFAALGQTDGALIIEVESGRVLKEVHRAGYFWTSGADAPSIASVDFSPDGSLLATGSSGTEPRAEAIIWSVPDGKKVVDLSARLPVTPRSSMACRVRFGSDQVVLTSFPGLVTVWDVSTGTALKHGVLSGPAFEKRSPYTRIEVDRSVADALALSQDAEVFAACYQSTVRIWASKPEWYVVCRPDGRYSFGPDDVMTANAVAFSPTGARIAAGAYGRARIWDVRTGNKEYEIKREYGYSSGGHAGFIPIESIAFMPDRKRLIMSTRETVDVWDIADNEIVVSHRVKGRVLADGQKFASVKANRDEKSATVTVHEALSGSVLHVLTLNGEPSWAAGRLAWNADGTRCAFIVDKAKIQLWDVPGEKIARQISPETPPTHVTMTPDGMLYAFANGLGSIEIREWDTDDTVASLRHEGVINALALSPDGRNLASSTITGGIVIWAVRRGREISRIDSHSHEVRLVFAPADRLLAVARETGEVALLRWDNEDLVPEAMKRAGRELDATERQRFLGSA